MASRRPTDSPRTSSPPTPSAAADSPSPENTATAARKPRAPRAKKVAAPKVQLPIEISEDVRRGMIAEAAYLRAERRGFSGSQDQEKEDWLLAEEEVDALLKAGQGSQAQ
jgi:hypothetical protein